MLTVFTLDLVLQVADQICIAKSIREEENADMDAVEEMIVVLPTIKRGLFARLRHARTRLAISSHFYNSRRQTPSRLDRRIRSGIQRFFSVSLSSV